jgi:hypothetical protein
VTIETPLGIAALREFCDDVERLYRLNPYLEIMTWQPLAAGRFHVAWRNLSNALAQSLDLVCERESSDAFCVTYSQGIKRRTRFAVERAPTGSRLTVTDDYALLPAEERLRRVAEADKSLDAWGWALRAYLRREHRWGGNALWRWTTRRVWLPMRPSARRITRIVLLVSAAEVVLTLVVVLIYWAEHG